MLDVCTAPDAGAGPVDVEGAQTEAPAPVPFHVCCSPSCVLRWLKPWAPHTEESLPSFKGCAVPRLSARTCRGALVPGKGSQRPGKSRAAQIRRRETSVPSGRGDCRSCRNASYTTLAIYQKARCVSSAGELLRAAAQSSERCAGHRLWNLTSPLPNQETLSKSPARSRPNEGTVRAHHGDFMRAR